MCMISGLTSWYWLSSCGEDVAHVTDIQDLLILQLKLIKPLPVFPSPEPLTFTHLLSVSII